MVVSKFVISFSRVPRGRPEDGIEVLPMVNQIATWHQEHCGLFLKANKARNHGILFFSGCLCLFFLCFVLEIHDFECVLHDCWRILGTCNLHPIPNAANLSQISFRESHVARSWICGQFISNHESDRWREVRTKMVCLICDASYA